MSCVVAVHVAGKVYRPERQRLPLAFVPTLHSNLRPRLHRFRLRADAENTNEPEKEEGVYEMPDNEPTLTGKIFGSYLQLGVWIVVLSFAGYKGFTELQKDPTSVGLLLAPPFGALILISTFLFNRFVSNKEDYQEEDKD